MMDSFARFAISRVRFSLLLIAAVLAAGSSAYLTQPRQEDPEVTLRNAQIVAQFPGMSPARIEELITRPIEDKIKEMSEIDEIKSISMSGMSIVTPSAHARYKDMDPIWTDLRNKMDDLAGSLPDGTQGPRVNDDFGQVAVVTLALTGHEFSMHELTETARDLKDSFSSLPLVAKVELYGVQQERIWLEFDPYFMSQFSLTPARIASAIQAQNVILPSGTVNAAGQAVVVESSGDFRSLEEIKNLAIETDDGEIVYLRDLASIRRGYVDPPKAPAFFDNQPAIVLGISMVSASNVVSLGQQVNQRLEELRPRLPLGMKLDIAIFQPDLVQASVRNATNNLLQTMAVVLIVVMLFLGLRTGLIVGAMVPLTMMATLVGMAIFGIELHRISIAAIIVALGLLVDNGVVVAEDIRTRLDNGVARFEAALAAPRTLAVPLLTSSLTTVLAFLPLGLVEDSTGEFLKALGQVLAISLLISWFLAISLTPALCYWFLKPTSGNEQQETASTGGTYVLYKNILSVLLRFRLVFIGLMILSLLAAGNVFQFVKQRSLGPSERNQFTVYLDLHAEAHISQTIAATQQLAQYLNDPQSNPEVVATLAYVGGGGPRFFLALSPNDPQPNKAFLVVNTRDYAENPQVMRRIEDYIDNHLPQANGRTQVLFLGSSALGTVELRIRGNNANTLLVLGAKVKQAFASISGVKAIRTDWENPVLKLQVEVDQERARRAGVTSQEIARTLSTTFDGQTVTNFRDKDRVIPIAFRASSDSRGNLDLLRTVEVFSEARGVSVPLLQVADFAGDVEPSRIRRIDQQRSLTVAAIHPDLTAIELYQKLGATLSEIEIPPGYSLEVAGEIKDSTESNSKLFAYAPHALFLIVALLVLQFNSFRRPAIILLTIPLVIVGANFGLAIFDAFFDFTAMLGLFSLAGIIINNGIVMIDRIDSLRAEGMDVDSAVSSAAVARARPIVMTTITTIVGLLPLALFGGEFWYGMAIVIMCGLGVGTVLTLGVVPVLYSLMFRHSTPQTERASLNTAPG